MLKTMSIETITSSQRSRRELIEEVIWLQEQIKKRIENATPPCPIDNKPGTFTRNFIKSYQTGIPIYKCPNGHTFSSRAGVGEKLLP